MLVSPSFQAKVTAKITFRAGMHATKKMQNNLNQILRNERAIWANYERK